MNNCTNNCCPPHGYDYLNYYQASLPMYQYSDYQQTIPVINMNQGYTYPTTMQTPQQNTGYTPSQLGSVTGPYPATMQRAPSAPITPPVVTYGTGSPVAPLPVPGPTPTLPPGFETDLESPTLRNIGYTPAYLRTKIGWRVRVEFLIGTDILTDRSGILVDVGISYIILRDINANNLILCDLYSIKFVTFFEE